MFIGDGIYCHRSQKPDSSLWIFNLSFMKSGRINTAIKFVVLLGLISLFAEMVPPERRGTAFGTFHTAFGLFWFAGSLLMARMYDSSILSLIIISVTSQVVALDVISYLILKKNPIR